MNTWAAETATVVSTAAREIFWALKSTIHHLAAKSNWTWGGGRERRPQFCYQACNLFLENLRVLGHYILCTPGSPLVCCYCPPTYSSQSPSSIVQRVRTHTPSLSRARCLPQLFIKSGQVPKIALKAVRLPLHHTSPSPGREKLHGTTPAACSGWSLAEDAKMCRTSYWERGWQNQPR